MQRLGRLGVAVLAALVLAGVVAVPAAVPAPIGFAPTPIAGWSTNGPVLAVRIVGDTVYVGGDFTEVRGPGGTPTVARARLAAFDVHTGALRDGFSADTDGRVESLASDGTRLFVGGDFMTVKGVSRVRLASLDLTTGNVNNGFFTGASSHVYALAVKGDRLYVGGSFGLLGSTPRSRIAALNTTTSAVDPSFNPGADNTVNGIAVSPDGNTVYAGGIFTTIGGGTRANVAPLSAATGALLPLTFDYPRFTGSIPALMDLDISPSGDQLFAALGGAENQALSWSTTTGARQWSHQVDGDTQAVRYSNGNVYFGFHEGDLGDPTVRMLGGRLGDRGDRAVLPAADQQLLRRLGHRRLTGCARDRWRVHQRQRRRDPGGRDPPPRHDGHDRTDGAGEPPRDRHDQHLHLPGLGPRL